MDKIFISIAAYRDPMLIRTLSQAYANADNRDALVFGIAMQYEREIYPDLSFIPRNQLRLIDYDIPTRPGVTRLRYQIANIAYGGEKYFLMIDSHMKFSPGWDTWLKESLESLGPKSIISGLGHIRDNKLEVSICELVQGGYGIAFQKRDIPVDLPPDEHGKFFKYPYIMCGFMFTYGSFVSEVGFDEYSQAEGEEVYLTWRAFMNGWDVYQTSKWMITHSPDEYFDEAWGGMEHRTYLRPNSERVFLHNMIMMKTLAYVYNDISHYAIKNAVRKPIDWFIANGYTANDYNKVLRHYDNLIHNNLSEHDILIL